MARELGGFTCLAIGLTTIVGSGIFALPPLLAEGLGPLSFLAFVGAALLVSLIGLMTAEAAGTTDRHGGTYQYVAMAFGKTPGFAVAWLSWVNNMLSWATVSLALVKLVEVVAPSLGRGYYPQLLATAEIVGLGVLNAMGVRPGAVVSNVLTVGKLVPLFLFVVIGILAFQPGSFAGSADRLAAAGASTFAVAVYRCIFAAGGFENIGVIAGDVRDPQRTIPRAVLLAIAASTVLYALVQIAAVSSVPELATLAPHGKPGSLALPLAGERAATHLAGSGFGAAIYGVILVGAVVSMVGYCAGVAIVAPRYLFALATDGFVPARMVKLDRRGTPVIAVLVATAVAVVGVWTVDWITMLDASVLFSLVQHSSTTAAAWKLRRTVPAAGRFVAPGGPLVPATALALVVALCAYAADLGHFVAIALVTGIGFATWGVTTLTRNRRPLRPG